MERGSGDVKGGTSTGTEESNFAQGRGGRPMFCGGQVVPHKMADGVGPCDDVQAGCEGHQQRHAAAVRG